MVQGVVLAALLFAQASAPLQPDILLFARARTKMQDHLRHQPNYVCLETLERTQRDPIRRRSSLLDVLRLEVAFVDNKEMYAWPGSNKFEDTELIDMVPAGGTIGSGAFASHAYNLFLTNAPRTMPGEWTELDGQRVARYPFEVAEMVSGYHLRVTRGDAAIVGYYGSIWIDPVSEEVTQIEVIADQIPARLGLKEARTIIAYGDVNIGGQPYRLPVRTVEGVTTFAGHENRNEGRFTACRQFVGESKLSFGDPPPEEAAPAPPPTVTEMILPEGLTIHLELVTPIDSDKSKTGDPVEAILASAIKQKKEVLFEKGSRVEGRIIRMQKLGQTIEAEVQFYSIASAARRAPFNAQVEGEPSTSSTRGRFNLSPGRIGSAKITVDSARLTLMRGSRSTWITVAPRKRS